MGPATATAEQMPPTKLFAMVLPASAVRVSVAVVTASPDRADLYEVRASWDGTTQRKYVVYHQSILVVFEWDEKFSSHAYDATSPDIRFYNLGGEELSRE